MPLQVINLKQLKIQQPTYKTFGEKAILIEWRAIINEETLQEILRFKNVILSIKSDEIEDTIIGYNSLTLKFSKPIFNFSKEVDQLNELYKKAGEINESVRFIWQIPVCYDVEFGIDLECLSEEKRLSVKQIIKLHTKPTYTIFFIGFLPGFLYLGGLEKTLHTPRKSNPRLRVAKGSVAIGGEQTGVYPQESSGGWNIIGRTPVSFFDVEKRIPCFSKSGDKIQFVPVLKDEFRQIEQQILENTYQLKRIKMNA